MLEHIYYNAITLFIKLKGVRHYTQCNLYTRKGKYGLCTSHRLNYDLLESDIIEYLRDICESFSKYYNFNELEDNSEEVIKNNLNKINKKIITIENKLNSYKTTIDNLYIDKVEGLVDKDMYKRIYDKSKIEIDKLEIELKELLDKKNINEKEQDNSSIFNRCKKLVLDYMSLKTLTRDQISRLIDKIEIDKDKKVYVYFKFRELLKQINYTLYIHCV